VLRHSRKVQEISLEIARKIPQADREFIRIASLLHDIGRFKCPPWKNSYRHGLEGGRILRKHGLTDFALVAERHLGAGITRQDITEQHLDLPKKDFMPKTIEEKIITFADKLVDGDKRIPLKQTVESFKKKVSTRAAERLIKLKEEILGLQKSGRPRKTEGRTGETGKKSSFERRI
jgi:uncharacterized protein (TIGR00295 family)